MLAPTPRTVDSYGMQTLYSGRAATRHLQPVSEDEAFGMAIVGEKRTGLPMFVYIHVQYAGHGPHMKVAKNYGDKAIYGDWFYMTISNHPRVIGDTGDIHVKDLALAEQFILVNKQLLLDYWEDKLEDAMDMIERLLSMET